jgi:hypothetical protein
MSKAQKAHGAEPPTLTDISKVPSTPAVYAMFGGRGANAFVAYVGIAEKLKQRLLQHLVRRDSSVVTGVTAVGLRPEFVAEVRWWSVPDFADRAVLEAAELVAFEVLDPALRSRGNVGAQAAKLHGDAPFKERMRSILQGSPSGVLKTLSLQDAFERIAELERRISQLEHK